MNQSNAAWFGRVETLVPEGVRRGVVPLVVLTGGCCVGALAGTIGAVVGAVGGIVGAATWLQRRGYLGARRHARDGDRT